MVTHLRIVGKRLPRALTRSISALPMLAALVVTATGCNSHSSGASSATGSSAGSTPGASSFDGAALAPGVSAPAFSLRDQAGPLVSLAAYRGQVVVVAFLYSTCGSACAVIAQQIRGALDELPKPVPVLVISADPSVDTPAHVARFLRRVSLGGRVRWLSGSPAELRAIWHAFRVPPASVGRAAFARAAPVFLIDRHGIERVVFQLEQLTPEALSHDLRKLLDEPGGPASG